MLMQCSAVGRRLCLIFFLSVMSVIGYAEEFERVQQKKANAPAIYGNTGWTDEGLNTLISDPDYRDPVSGELGLHRFLMSNPCQQRRGNIEQTSCADLRVLVLFVDFSDRRVEDAEEKFQAFQTYLDFLTPAAQWLQQSSFGQLQLRFVAPQRDRQLNWIRLSRAATDYVVNREDHLRFAYVREIAQAAYDRYQIRVDDYDTVLIMPVKGSAGLPNGPATISAHYVGESRFSAEVAYVDQQGKAHGLDHFITAGNDLFRWGPLWFVHELGHLFGLPDTYLYETKIRGQEVNRFFYVGGWDMMGNIGGHSPDFFGWHKLKLRWLNDQQVITVANTVRHSIYRLTPVEAPDGVKLIVIQTGLRTAYVAELRSGAGVNAWPSIHRTDLPDTARRGVLIYRIDAGTWLSTDTPVAQVISRAYYHSAMVGKGENKTGFWRALDNSADAQLGGALWQEGDVFDDPKTGVRIGIDQLMLNAENPVENSARIVVTATRNLPKAVKPVLSIVNACIRNETELDITLNRSPRSLVTVVGDGAEGPKSLQQEIPFTRLVARDFAFFVLRRGTRWLNSEQEIVSMNLEDKRLRLQLKPGVLGGGVLRLSIKETMYFAAAAPVALQACK